ncbi:MAG: hypothetical protein V4726_07135 [Verrucomicrobiota bacterium]
MREKEGAWLTQVFSAAAASNDGIVRRKKSSVHENASFEELKEFVLFNDFHLIETGDQYVVFCNGGALTIHC